MTIWQIFLPVIIGILVQGIKILIEMFKDGFSWTHVFSYGGMPSSHSAMVTSLATMVYLNDGLSPTLAVATTLAIIVIRDAIGFRSYLSLFGRNMNKIIKDLPPDKEYHYQILPERIAHTWPQVIVGSLLGIIFTWLIFDGLTLIN
jgi:acid phosphatase family membrane protein YuiD